MFSSKTSFNNVWTARTLLWLVKVISVALYEAQVSLASYQDIFCTVLKSVDRKINVSHNFCQNFPIPSMNVRQFNPYPGDHFFAFLRYMPNSRKVTLRYFIHTLPSVRKVPGTKVLQKFLVFTHVFNIVNLLWIG